MVRLGYVFAEDVGVIVFLTNLVNRLPLAGFTAQRSSLSSIARRVSVSLLRLIGSSIVSVSDPLYDARGQSATVSRICLGSQLNDRNLC
jgi:hypothetical protein